MSSRFLSRVLKYKMSKSRMERNIYQENLSEKVWQANQANEYDHRRLFGCTILFSVWKSLFSFLGSISQRASNPSQENTITRRNASRTETLLAWEKYIHKGAHRANLWCFNASAGYCTLIKIRWSGQHRGYEEERVSIKSSRWWEIQSFYYQTVSLQ